MITRALELGDMDRIRELSKKHYPDHDIPDFVNGYYCAFVITNEKNDIIIAGGVKPSAEILLVTDKDKSFIQIGRALVEAQKSSLYIGQQFGLDELVAFIDGNDAYVRHLIRHGFYSRSPAIAIKVP